MAAGDDQQADNRKRVPLTRDAISLAALELVDKVGIEKLTTRRLGEVLGVEGPALYRHFATKAELLDHAAGALLLPVLRSPKPNEPWDEWLRAICNDALTKVLKFRDGARLVARALPTDPHDLLSRPLREAGFREEEAIYASKLITRFMVGWQLHEDMERHRDDRPPETYDHQEAFDFALECLLNGLRMRLARSLMDRTNGLTG